MRCVVAFDKKKSPIKRKGSHKIRVDTARGPSFRRRKVEAKWENCAKFFRRGMRVERTVELYNIGSRRDQYFLNTETIKYRWTSAAYD